MWWFLLAACVTAVLLCAPAAAAEAPVRVEASYELVRGDHGLDLRERITVGLPPSTPGLAEVVRYPEDSERRGAAAAELVDRLAGDVKPPEVGTRVTLDVWDERAHLRWGSTRSVRELDDAPEWDGLVPDAAGASFVKLLRDGQRLRVHVAPTVGPEIVSAVTLRVEPGRIAAASPLPVDASPHEVRWRFRAQADAVVARASIELDEEVLSDLRRNDSLRSAVTSASNAIGPVLVLVLVLMYVGGQTSSARSVLRRVAMAAIVFTLAAIGASVTLIARDGVPWLRDPSDDYVGQLLLTGVPLVLVLAAALALAVAARGGGPRRAAVHGALGAVLGIAVALLSTAATNANPRPEPLGTFAELTWVGVLVPLILVAALAGAISFRLAEPPLTPRLPGAGAIGVALVFGLAATVQYVLGTHGDGIDVPLDDRAWWEMLPFFAQFSAVSIATSFVTLLPALLLLAALPWLRERLEGLPATAQDWSQRPIRVVVFLFAGVVLGFGGRVEYVQLPLGFVLWLILAWLVFRRRPADLAAPARMTNEQHAATLLRAVKLEAARRHAAKLRGELSAAGWNDASAETTLATAEARETDLETLGSDAPAGQENVPTLLRALAVGPFDDAWRNGCVAARLGLYVAVVPVVYAWAVLIDRDGERALAAGAQDGLVMLLTQLAGEAATWLALAFTFGVLYAVLPGRTAMLKALVFSVATGVGLALTDVLSGPPDDTWPPRAFQMALFLVVVGVLIDRRTLTERGLKAGDLPALYRLRDLRFAAGYVPTVVLLVLAVVQQLISGEAENAVVEALQGLTGVLPPQPR